jgi:putative tricarboxylic transport membrane protein
MYSVNNNPSDLILLAVFTVSGVALKLARYPLAPAVLAFILGHTIEAAMRQSLVIGNGNGLIFFNRPLSAAFLATAAIVVVTTAVRTVARFRNERAATAA